MRSWPGTIAAAAVAVIVAGSATAQQRQWFQLYDEAIVDVRQGAWQQAETKLRQAQKLGPAPGRNVLRYGMMRGNFFPDFYLGVVFLNTGRPMDALRQFALARAQKINDQDREFGTIADMENQARVDAKRLADAEAMPTTTTPPKPVPVEPAAPDPPRVDGATLPSAPPVVDTAPERKSTTTADAAAAERERRRDAGERDAMRQFFAGEYRQSVATLDKVERDIAARLSPRGYFYRACALAAQVLRSSSPDARLLEDARRQYTEAMRDGQALRQDRRYISPRVLQALGS